MQEVNLRKTSMLAWWNNGNLSACFFAERAYHRLRVVVFVAIQIKAKRHIGYTANPEFLVAQIEELALSLRSFESKIRQFGRWDFLSPARDEMICFARKVAIVRGIDTPGPGDDSGY